MKLKTVKRDGVNERAYIVVDENDFPIDRVCWFTTNELAKWANTTQKFQTRNIMHIERWAESKKVNLEEEFNSSCLLDPKKYKSLIKHLQRFSSDSGEVTLIAPRLVIPKYFNDRIDTCISYFDYLVRAAVEKRRPDDPMVKQLEDKLDKLKGKLVKDKIPKDEVSLRKGLTLKEQEALFLSINEPEIFGWNQATSLRNELIIRLFLSTGIRKAELLSLKIDDCITTRLRIGQQPHILVKQNVSFRDPRTDVPQMKTLSRAIPISHRLCNLIEEYKKNRPQNDLVKKQPPYLILSSRFPHLPLSSSSINSIFDSIRAKLPDLEHLGSHRLRHTFFENFERTLQKNDYDEALKKKLANSIGGWSRKSETRKIYQTLATEEQCQTALEAMHKQFESSFDDLPF